MAPYFRRTLLTHERARAPGIRAQDPARGGDGAPKAGELVEGIAKLRRENERLQREVDRLHAALDAERQDAAQARQDFLAEDRVRNADVQRLYQELLLRANTTGSSEESANGS